MNALTFALLVIAVNVSVAAIGSLAFMGLSTVLHAVFPTVPTLTFLEGMTLTLSLMVLTGLFHRGY